MMHPTALAAALGECNAARRANDPVRCASAAKAALATDRSSQKAWSYLCWALFAQKEYSSARAACTRALELPRGRWSAADREGMARLLSSCRLLSELAEAGTPSPLFLADVPESERAVADRARYLDRKFPVPRAVLDHPEGHPSDPARIKREAAQHAISTHATWVAGKLRELHTSGKLEAFPLIDRGNMGMVSAGGGPDDPALAQVALRRVAAA